MTVELTEHEKTVEYIKAGLPKGEVVVEFVKLDGDRRLMTCTLDKNVIPAPTKDPVTQDKVRKVNENVCVAWDVNANGWRSFRWDRVVSAK